MQNLYPNLNANEFIFLTGGESFDEEFYEFDYLQQHQEKGLSQTETQTHRIASREAKLKNIYANILHSCDVQTCPIFIHFICFESKPVSKPVTYFLEGLYLFIFISLSEKPLP